NHRNDAVAFPAVLADRGNQLFGSMEGEPAICCVERAASAFALVLESDGPIWALDTSAVWFGSH
ncbi:MAG: hypothetical protein QHJ82_16250, partial [Verrucomicrobiota bacterium]|nr:hypothetical protein [Verrucomicrobiota bacterium]